MDRRQKEKLRFLLKARKRADRVLKERREAEQKKLDRQKHLETNRERMEQFSQMLDALAEESGIRALADEAALRLGGSLDRQCCYYLHYPISTSGLQQALADAEPGELRASHLALRITWGEQEAEIRVHKNGQITFHHSLLPLPPFVWRRYPQLLQRMLEGALRRPRPLSVVEKKARG